MPKSLIRSPHDWRASARKYGGRIVALLLAFCLVADPTLAAALHNSVLSTQYRFEERTAGAYSSGFHEEALAGTAVFMQSLWLGGVRQVRRTITDEDRLIRSPLHSDTMTVIERTDRSQALGEPGAWGVWKLTWGFWNDLNPLRNAFALKRAARLEGIISLLFMMGSVVYLLIHRNLSVSAGSWEQVFSPATLWVALSGAVPVLFGHLTGVLQADGTIKKSLDSYGIALLRGGIAVLAAPVLVLTAASPLRIVLLLFAYHITTGPHIALNPMSEVPDRSEFSMSAIARIGSYVIHGVVLLWLIQDGWWSMDLLASAIIVTAILVIRSLLPDSWTPATDRRSFRDELKILAGWLVALAVFVLPNTQLRLREFEKRLKEDHPMEHFIHENYRVIPLGPNSRTSEPAQKGQSSVYAFRPSSRTARKNLNTVQPAAAQQRQGAQNTVDWTSPFYFATRDLSRVRTEMDPFVMTREEMKDWSIASTEQDFHVQGHIRGIRIHLQKADEGDLTLQFEGDVAIGKRVVSLTQAIHFNKTDGQEEEVKDILFRPEDIQPTSDQVGHFHQSLIIYCVKGQKAIQIKIRAIEFLETEQKPGKNEDQFPAPPPYAQAGPDQGN